MPSEKLLTRLQLATALDAHPRSVSRWLEEGMPVAKPGRGGHASLFRLADVRAWLMAREAASPAAEFQQARIRKELAQAAEAEQRVAQRAGRLLAVEDVEKTWSSMVAAMRARLLALPTALSDKVCRLAVTDGVAAVEAELERAVHEALRELAEDKPAQAGRAKARKPAPKAGRKARRTRR